MKILITGANGFVGSSIVDYISSYQFKNLLHKNSEQIIINCMVRKSSNVKRLNSIIEKIDKIKNISLNFVYGDIREPQTLSDAIKGVDIIIHCAALLRTNNVQEYYDVNHIGTKNLLETIRLHNPNLKCLIAISSQAVSGPCDKNQKKSVDEICAPVSHYGKSKLLAETELLKYSKIITTIVLRPGPIYGPYDKDMFLYFQYAKKGLLPIFSNEFFIQFTFIDDLANVCTKIIEFILDKTKKINPGIYFVAEEKCYSIEELKDIFSETVGKKIKIFKLPSFVAYSYAYINELVHKFLFKKPAVFNRDKLNELKQKYWLCHSSTIKEILDVKYTPLIDGIRKTYQWYKENKWL